VRDWLTCPANWPNIRYPEAMPLIEYECQDCHKRVEKIQPFSAAPQTVCPHCGGRLEQTISAPAVQFKGSGWYVNDYAKSGAAKPSASDKADGGDKSEGAKSSGSADGGAKDGGAKAEGASAKKESASTPAPSTAASTGSSSKSDS
jgi:putative FmdB family regulatory protein